MRLIDAEYLKNLITETAKEFDNIEVHNIACLFNALIDDIRTVDAVEVVRCKDCIHNINTPEVRKITGAYWCTYKLQPCGDNDFCSYGVRKGEE